MIRLSIRSELDKTKDILLLKESEVRDLKSEVSSTSIMKKEYEENKKNSQAKITDLQKQLNTAHEDVKQLRAKQRDSKKDADAKQQIIDELNIAIESMNTRMERDRTHLMADVESLTNTVKSYQDQLTKERSTMATLRSENEAVSSQCRKLNDKNSSLNIEMTALKTKIQQLEGYVEQRIVDSNAGLRHFSQNTPTAKKNATREEVERANLDDKRSNELG